MDLSRFDLTIIKRALKLLLQVERGGVFSKEILQSTESAVADILTEYPNSCVFLVQPDPLEGNTNVFLVQPDPLEG